MWEGEQVTPGGGGHGSRVEKCVAFKKKLKKIKNVLRQNIYFREDPLKCSPFPQWIHRWSYTQKIFFKRSSMSFGCTLRGLLLCIRPKCWIKCSLIKSLIKDLTYSVEDPLRVPSRRSSIL